MDERAADPIVGLSPNVYVSKAKCSRLTVLHFEYIQLSW